MTEQPWIPYAVEFVSDLDRPELAVSPWGGHRWFAYDLTRWAKPQSIVELGTHYGCSYFAFCQALLADQSQCEVMAIDTWEGEEHTGLYSEEVFDTFTSVLERRFAAVQTNIQRSMFDDALELVADQSIDILHIDGLHTYEAVSHDYRTWKDKVARNGIVLFHDVAPSSGYGSAKFWQEIREDAPGFAFMHSFGLGVLLPNGTEGREALLELGQSPWRSFYEYRAGHDLFGRQVTDLSEMVEARDQALTATEKLVLDRDEALASTEKLVLDRDEALASTAKLVIVRDELLAAAEKLVHSRNEELSAADTALKRINAEVEALEERSSAAEKAVADTRAVLERRDGELSVALRERDANKETARTAMAAAEGAAAELERLHHHIAVLTEDRDALAAGLDLYRRTFKPVRWAAGPPRRALRRIRGRGIPSLQESFEPDTQTPALIASSEPPALFDRDWYLARYPDVGRAGVDPWSHWSNYGWKEGREPCPLFNAGTYLEQNPDLAASGHDPLQHWITNGANEGRDPSELFSTDFYRRKMNDDPDLSGDENPLEHYLASGIEQGLFVSSEHEQRVLHSQGHQSKGDEVLVDVIVHHPDGTNQSVPFSVVADLNADLFTFDLWDSILIRSRPADASKLATARRIRLALGLGPNESPSTWELMKKRVEIEASMAGPTNGEYLLGSVLIQLLEEITGSRATRSGTDGLGSPGKVDIKIEALADHLRQAELDDEKASTTPIDETVLIMEKLLGRGGSTRVAVVSDFYLGGEDLRELLAYHGIGSDRLPVISSADVGRSKHSDGALLHWVREEFGVPAERHVHVGDNPHSDVAMQTATGGTAVYLAHGSRRYVGPGQLTETNIGEVVAELGAELDATGELHCRQAGLRPRPKDRVLRAAWRTALLPVALVAAAIEDAEARGLDRVHYLSREGLFLSKIHDEVAAILSPQGHPAAVHLAVSRRSTFGPSLTEITPSSLLDLWRMYSRQTPRGLLVSLGVSAEEYQQAARRHGLKLDEVIDGVHLDPRIRGFLEDEVVAKKLLAANSERSTALLSYLRSQTNLDHDQLLVVDVGWRGTVQDNLARLLPETQFVGWYLALFPFLNPQQENCTKFSVGPDGNQGQEFAYMEPPAAIERPWTPAAPSVVDYRLGEGSAAVPVLDEESLTAEGRAAIELYQNAVAAAAPMVARWIVANGMATDVLGPVIEEQLSSYYKNPEPGIADLWFDTAHDDTFGVLNVTSFGKDRPRGDWLHDGLGPGFLRHLEDAATNSLWPSGYRRWYPVQAASAVEKALRTRSFNSDR